MEEDRKSLITEDAIRDILESQKDEIQARVSMALIENAAEVISWRVRERMQKQVDEFFDSEMEQLVRDSLGNNRDAIIAGIETAAVQIGAAISAVLAEKAVKNLQQSWNAKKLVEALLE